MRGGLSAGNDRFGVRHTEPLSEFLAADSEKTDANAREPTVERGPICRGPLLERMVHTHAGRDGTFTDAGRHAGSEILGQRRSSGFEASDSPTEHTAGQHGGERLRNHAADVVDRMPQIFAGDGERVAPFPGFVELRPRCLPLWAVFAAQLFGHPARFHPGHLAELAGDVAGYGLADGLAEPGRIRTSCTLICAGPSTEQSASCILNDGVG